MPALLHVANGTATTSKFEAAGIPGARSIWADVLYEGPVPSVSDAELLELRARFLGPSPDPANDLREWRGAMARHDAYDELVLWYEHDLFDQLNLLQLLSWIRDHVPRAKPVSLICVGSFPGHPNFKGLGELTPAELATLLDARQPVTNPQYDLARRAWQAFREPAPAALDELRQQDTSALPYLGAALTRFLQEYPWTSDGLSRTERRLLQLADGGIGLWTSFPRMSEGEQAYYVTDGSLDEMADALSRTSPPLLTRDSDTIALTDAGRAVLASHLDRVATCGIDRWLGGVHLQGRGTLWRWDDSSGRIVHA